MPTPPTGDMAWAASPMQNSPGRAHLLQPVHRHGQQLDLVEIGDGLVHPAAAKPAICFQPGAEFGQALAP